MSVKIRLSRIGKKHVPFYRVVAVDSRKKRDGAVLANIGTYDGLKSAVVRFDEALYGEWISKGAQVTDSAKKIYKQFKKVGVGVTKSTKVAPVSKKSAQKAEEQKAEEVKAKTAETATEKKTDESTEAAE